MICGDSMVAGNGVGAADPGTATGFREAFYQTLREYRGNIRFLGDKMTGRQTGGGCLLGDWHYSGKGGNRIDQIDAEATTSRTSSGAVDVYVLEGGINDLVQALQAGDTQAQAVSLATGRLATSIANRRAADPLAWIGVLDLGPIPSAFSSGIVTGTALEAARVAYNAALPATIAAAGPYVDLVQAFSLLAPAHIGADNEHPAGDGYSIVGRAIAAWVKKRFPQPVGAVFPRKPIRRLAQPTLTLNGGTDNIAIPTSTAVSPTGFASFTVGIKVRPSALSTTYGVLRMGSTYDVGGLCIALGSDHSLHVYLDQAAAADVASVINGSRCWEPGAWTTICVTADAAALEVVTYAAKEGAHGVPTSLCVSAGNVNGLSGGASLTPLAAWNCTANTIQIGRLPGNFNSLNGEYADFWVANGVVVSPDDIEAWLVDGKVPPGVTAHYPLNDGSGTSIAGKPALSAGTLTGGTWNAAGVVPMPHEYGQGDFLRPALTQATIAPGTIAANSVWESAAITVDGACVGDTVQVGPPAAPTAGVSWSAYVSAAGQVKLRVANGTTGGIAVTSATWTFGVQR